MNIKGCLLSTDKTDKVLVAAQLDPDNCSILIMDKSKKPLGKVHFEIHDGQVYLIAKYSAYTGEPTEKILIATL